MTRRIGILGAAAACGLAVIGGVSLASDSATAPRTNAWGIPGLVPHAAAPVPDITSGTTIVVFARDGSETDVDEPPAGESQGDETASHMPLFMGGRRVGRIDVSSVETEANFTLRQASVQFIAVATLRAGAITATGVLRFTQQTSNATVFTGAVTGGTGLYQNVRGEVHIQFTSQNAVKLTFHLIP